MKYFQILLENSYPSMHFGARLDKERTSKGMLLNLRNRKS